MSPVSRRCKSYDWFAFLLSAPNALQNTKTTPANELCLYFGGLYHDAMGQKRGTTQDMFCLPINHDIGVCIPLFAQSLPRRARVPLSNFAFRYFPVMTLYSTASSKRFPYWLMTRVSAVSGISIRISNVRVSPFGRGSCKIYILLGTFRHSCPSGNQFTLSLVKTGNVMPHVLGRKPPNGSKHEFSRLARTPSMHPSL